MKKIFLLAICMVLPATAFFTAYRLTDRCFQIKKIPYPFELFGVATGLGAASLALAVLCFVFAILRISVLKKTMPYVVRENLKFKEEKLLK